jgi:two-component system cell cycle sensor histidine kinase/response regulator CckA
VFGIVRQHGDFVSVDSEPDCGTTFRIYLPAIKTAIVSTPSPRSKPDETVFRGGTETILVADDHEGIREMVRTALVGCGYRVLLAVNGDEAIRVFAEQAPQISLVVLDMVMPRIGGLEAARRMRQMNQRLPVIFTTGYSSENEALTGVIQSGGVELQKPFDPTKLARRVRELLDACVATSEVSQISSVK